MKISLAYKLVVTGMALSAMNLILGRLGVSSGPIEPKGIITHGVSFAVAGSHPGDPMRPSANFQTTNFAFIFREGKLYLVMNKGTNIEEVEHYREWAKMPSLIDSNSAYHLATNWLSRVYVDVPTLNRKYELHVGQPSFWASPPERWGEQGSNLTTLPLYYVTWSKGDYQAAKVGIFGPTKQFMGLTIEDATLTDHTYLCVTNNAELLNMTNTPSRLIEGNPGLYQLFAPRAPPVSRSEAW